MSARSEPGGVGPVDDGHGASSVPADTTGPEVATVGETMVLLSPDPAGPLDRADRLGVSVGGAESNVAVGLAALGHRVSWVSRVGDDPFGRRVVRQVAAAGVDTTLVEVDPAAPTGVYLKDPAPGGTAVHYYRAGSAASRLGPQALDDRRLAGVRLLHLSGVTAALSPSCTALMERALVGRPLPGTRVSFDVNHRARLWPAPTAAPVLRRLADHADVVLVGLDEARTLWDTPDPVAVRTLLPGPELVVVKDAAVGATALPRAGAAVFVPALPVPVREPVGAGDAFAAGFLSGLLRGLAPRDCLRLGHLCAAPTLTVAGDTAPPPDPALIDRLLALPDAGWAALDPVAVGLVRPATTTDQGRNDG
ncbi:sugar kinase [Micromonospora halophytica]|uniref:2-dehydro-3-deoxygluconokinase n=1 Tax=Micromonospora halophytica TaxID=47864 RepID=A0A1C5HI73_9ACTN|nr:sugar kinase [Micromonospora halophytica]SCG45718.1 2-dehydro-3-deoxygluconokinase [Micromonospora halophytica]